MTRGVALTGICVSVLPLLSCALPQDDAAARRELAPTGPLRAGINFGNVLLTRKDPATGEPGGVAVDMARELARRLDVAIEIVPYDSAGALADAAATGRWDVGFLGAEPQRAAEIDFTAAYAEIESTYLAPPGSSFQRVEDVDRDGVRIAVAEKSAYDLYLTCTLTAATLERAAGTDAAFERFTRERLDAMAGLRPVLVTHAEKLPGARVLDGRFSTVQQAAGTPRGRPVGAAYLRAFVEEAKRSGFVADAIERNGVRGLTVAPPAPAE